MRSLMLLSSTMIPIVSGFGMNSIWGTQNVKDMSTNPYISSSRLYMAGRRGRPRGPLRTIEVKPPMNDEIKFDTLRVTTPNPKGKDETLGVMSKSEALAKAKEMGGLDLILINENSDPPVCKIADYSKYRYMKEKKAKELKKNAKATEVKEVKMSYKIDVHDYGVRKKSAAKFLNQGNRVKCTVMFKGREIQHDKLGFELLSRLATDLEDLCVMEGKPKREGRNLSCFITPKPAVVKAISDNKRKQEKAKRKEREKSLQEFEEKSEAKKAAAAATVATVTTVEKKDEGTSLSLEELLEGTANDDDDDELLDDLMVGDGVTDDLFG